MYSTNFNSFEPVPISEQFSEVLNNDIQDYVEALRQLNQSDIALAIQNAREQMLSESIIKQPAEFQSLASMVAVDGGNNVLSIGFGTQCFVVSVIYSLRQNFNVSISMERLSFESQDATSLMYGVRNAMEIQDVYIANEQESFCIIDNSWVSLLENVNRLLVNFARNNSDNDLQIIERFVRPMLSSSGHFVSIIRHPRNIAISKGGVSRFYCDRYGGEDINLLDKVFLLGILREGEYTEPIPLRNSGIGQLNVHTHNLFESQNDIKDIYNSTLASTGTNCICSTYFKPHSWSPVKRIEFNRELLRNGRQQFFQMLATVKDSMSVPTIHEPIEQFIVDQIVKRHSGRLPWLYQTVGTANIQDFTDENFATQLIRRFRT